MAGSWWPCRPVADDRQLMALSTGSCRQTTGGRPRKLIINTPNGHGMDGTPQEITTLVGREVYSNNGVFVGEIEDVRLDVDAVAVTGIALGELNQELFSDVVDDEDGVMIPYRWVRAVGDVVLINDTIERLQRPESGEEEVAV